MTRLEGAIGDADDLADVGGSLYAQLNAATANVTQLTDQLEAATGNIQRFDGPDRRRRRRGQPARHAGSRESRGGAA